MGAITAAGKIPLNHYLTENPEKTASKYRCKAFALNVLEKISWVALIAIMAVVLAVSYSGVTMTGTLSLALVAMAFSTIFFAWGLSKFRIGANYCAKEAEKERLIAAELKKIGKWTEESIKEFMTAEGLDPNRLPLDALRQIHRDKPLLALLPLIARYNYFKQRAKEQEGTSIACFTEREQFLGLSDQDRSLRKKAGELGRHLHMYEAIPAALDAAVMLRIIQDPTRELSLSDIAKYVAKDSVEQALDERYPPINDTYLILHNNRGSLTLKEIEAVHLAPKELYSKLFPQLAP